MLNAANGCGEPPSKWGINCTLSRINNVE